VQVSALRPPKEGLTQVVGACIGSAAVGGAGRRRYCFPERRTGAGPERRTAPAPNARGDTAPVKRSTRRGLTGLTLVVAAPFLAGCGLSPSGTTRPYNPSDGVSSAIGTVQVRNLLIVASAAGAPGVVSAALLNDGTRPVTVTVGLPGAEGTAVEVPAQGSVLLGAKAGEPSASPGLRRAVAAIVQFASLPQPPGAFIDVTLSSPAGGTTTVNVPVLPPTLEYRTITPTGPSPTTTPTSPPAPTSGGAGSASGSGSPTVSVTGTRGPTAPPPTGTTTRPPTPTSAPGGTASADPNASLTQ